MFNFGISLRQRRCTIYFMFHKMAHVPAWSWCAIADNKIGKGGIKIHTSLLIDHLLKSLSSFIYRHWMKKRLISTVYSKYFAFCCVTLYRFEQKSHRKLFAYFGKCEIHSCRAKFAQAVMQTVAASIGQYEQMTNRGWITRVTRNQLKDTEAVSCICDIS